jgi:hypothetical protein
MYGSTIVALDVFSTPFIIYGTFQTCVNHL